MLYVILLNIHKRLSHFVRREEKKELLHSLALALALALTLTLTLTLTFTHLANELLQATIMLYGLMNLTYGSVTEHKVCDGL